MGSVLPPVVTRAWLRGRSEPLLLADVRHYLNGRSGRAAVEELCRIFAATGATGTADVVSYCGSGVTACHNLLAM